MLATALGVPLTDLLQYSGLRARLRTALMTWQHQAPSPDELAALPRDLRSRVATFCEGLAGFNANQETMKSVKVELESLDRQSVELMKQNDQAWSNIRAGGDRETTFRLLAELEERSGTLKQTSDRASDLLQKLQESFERHTSQAAALATVASLLDAALDAYCVRE